MRFAFNEWNLGGKVIFVSACLAFISMFMPWIDAVLIKSNGFSNGAFLLLGLFVYPILMLLQNMFINMQIGYGCAGLSVLITLIIIYRIAQAGFGIVNVTGIGAYLFLLTSIALGVGVYLYYNHTDGYNNYYYDDDEVYPGQDTQNRGF